MKNFKDSHDLTISYFILNHEKLQPGDIILERGYGRHSDIISKQTGSHYSHAMINVENTIIEATMAGGVFSRVPNRSVVRAITDFKVLRLAEYPGKEKIDILCTQARYRVGSQYSVAEAILVKGLKFTQQFFEDSRKQFCSRLVAQCYQDAGLELVSNAQFCSPADIEQSELLQTIPGMVRLASEHEIKHAHRPSSHLKHTQDTNNFVKAALKIFARHNIKEVGTSDGEVRITTLSDISNALYINKNTPGLDIELTKAMYKSGYLNHVDNDKKGNPFRYDYNQFHAFLEQFRNEDKISKTLLTELKKEYDSCLPRLAEYLRCKETLEFNMKFFNTGHSMQYRLLQGIFVRTLIIWKYLRNRKNTSAYDRLDEMSKKILCTILEKAPEIAASL